MSATKAMILAAGRGERMRPLTDMTPKPLLAVHGKPLMQWPMEALAAGGFTDLVVNTAWLGEQIATHFGPSLTYSHEGRDFGGALETAGGVVRALPLLGDVFWVVSGDVFIPGFRFDAEAARRFAAGTRLGHLWLVPNPPHHPRGDFGIGPDGLALSDAAERFTWASVGLFRAGLVDGVVPGQKAALRPCLEAAIVQRRLGAELWTGEWTDVGTPERLAALNVT